MRNALRTADSAGVVPLHPASETAPARPPSDGELLNRCRARDAAAWNQLVGRYERLVYSVALRNGLDADDAADVTQNTFVNLLDAMDRIRDEERLASWLMTVARRQAWRVRTRAALDLR